MRYRRAGGWGPVNGCFTLPDSDSDSEGFPFGYSCNMLNVHVAQIQTQIPILNGRIGNQSPGPNPSPPMRISYNVFWISVLLLGTFSIGSVCKIVYVHVCAVYIFRTHCTYNSHQCLCWAFTKMFGDNQQTLNVRLPKVCQLNTGFKCVRSLFTVVYCVVRWHSALLQK